MEGCLRGRLPPPPRIFNVPCFTDVLWTTKEKVAQTPPDKLIQTVASKRPEVDAFPRRLCGRASRNIHRHHCCPVEIQRQMDISLVSKVRKSMFRLLLMQIRPHRGRGRPFRSRCTFFLVAPNLVDTRVIVNGANVYRSSTNLSTRSSHNPLTSTGPPVRR